MGGITNGGFLEQRIRSEGQTGDNVMMTQKGRVVKRNLTTPQQLLRILRIYRHNYTDQIVPYSVIEAETGANKAYIYVLVGRLRKKNISIVTEPRKGLALIEEK